MTWGDDPAAGKGLEDLVTDLLGMEAVAGLTAVLGGGHVDARLRALKRHLTEHHLFDVTPDEIDILAVQQAQWEATAYREAGEILQRARRQAVRRRAPGSRPAPNMANGNPRAGYHGRHEAAGSLLPVAAAPERPQLSEEMRMRLRAVRGQGNFRRQVCGGGDEMLVEVLPDALDRLRPQLWNEVLRVVREEYPGDRATLYQLVDETFEWANAHLDTRPADPARITGWIRFCVLRTLHARTATASRDRELPFPLAS